MRKMFHSIPSFCMLLYRLLHLQIMICINAMVKYQEHFFKASIALMMIQVTRMRLNHSKPSGSIAPRTSSGK